MITYSSMFSSVVVPKQLLSQFSTPTLTNAAVRAGPGLSTNIVCSSQNHGIEGAGSLLLQIFLQNPMTTKSNLHSNKAEVWLALLHNQENDSPQITTWHVETERVLFFDLLQHLLLAINPAMVDGIKTDNP